MTRYARAMDRFLLVAALLVAACGASSDPAPAPRPSTGSGGGGVSLRAEAVTGGHALVIENGTASAIRLRREIEVERESGGTWSHVDASWLLLRETCDVNDPPACIEIAGGATFRAAPWTDMTGDAQCACEECGPAGAGTYRFAVTPCEAGTRMETAAFAVE